ncbi:hypothetical protein PLESTM_001517700 [Pleodorina starrii]|nr:hypothetical protein PLESTM_001517700 [Pleodorina starrii]
MAVPWTLASWLVAPGCVRRAGSDLLGPGRMLATCLSTLLLFSTLRSRLHLTADQLAQKVVGIIGADGAGVMMAGFRMQPVSNIELEISVIPPSTGQAGRPFRRLIKQVDRELEHRVVIYPSAMGPVLPASIAAPDPLGAAGRRSVPPPCNSGERAVATSADDSKPHKGDGAAAAAAHGPSGAPQPPAASPQLPTYQHLILPPLPPSRSQPSTAESAAGATAADTAATSPAAGEQGAAAEECLLVIVPGALLPPAAFKALAESIQQAAAPHLRMWVGVLNLNFLDIQKALCGPDATIPDVLRAMDECGAFDTLLCQAVEQAAGQGFVPRREGTVRLSNLAVICQSAGCYGFASAAAKSAAATVLLGGVPNLPDYMQMGVFSMEAWPRPLMLVVGELDGQMRWPLLSSYIAESAAMATKFGSAFTAAAKPVVVVPGVNHGNTSSGDARVQRGDITAGVAHHSACMSSLGGLLASFVTTHLAAPGQTRSQARRALLDAVRQSAQLTAPYCIARGLGDPAAAFAAAATLPAPDLPSPSPCKGPCRVGGLVAGAQRVAGRANSTALPPGEVVAAEAHAVELQRAVLAGLPASQLQRLAVVATAHTDMETFLYSQTLMMPLEEGGEDGEDGSGNSGRWLLHVHVMLHFRSMDAPGQYLAAQAPDYWLKMKCAAFVAAMLGLPDPSQYTSPTPSELNRLAMETALAAVPAGVAERYRALGRPMEFGPDVDVLAPGPDGAPPAAATPEAFVRHTRLSFQYPPSAPPEHAPATPSPSATSAAASAAAVPATGGDSRPGAVQLCSPYLRVEPPADVGSQPPSETRFLGLYYAKLLSVAQAMEWVALDSLRLIDTPW